MRFLLTKPATLRPFESRIHHVTNPNQSGANSSQALRHKLATYFANGTRLGWLLVAQHRAGKDLASG